MSPKISIFISNFFSIVFHPIAMPTLTFAILMVYSPAVLNPIPERFFLLFLIFVFVSTMVLPALMIYGLYGMKAIKDLELNNNKERIIAMISTVIIYSLLFFYLLEKMNISKEFSYLFFISIFSQIFAIIITIFWKISLHAIAVSSVVFYLFFLTIYFQISALLNPLMCMIIIAGFVMSSRLNLQKHNPKQIAAGVFLSFVVTFLVVSLVKA